MREFFITQVDTHVDTVGNGVESTVDEGSLHHPSGHSCGHVESTVDEGGVVTAGW